MRGALTALLLLAALATCGCEDRTSSSTYIERTRTYSRECPDGNCPRPSVYITPRPPVVIIDLDHHDHDHHDEHHNEHH